MARKTTIPTRISPTKTAWFAGMCVTICLLIVPLSGCTGVTPLPEPATASANGLVTVRYAGYYMDEEYYRGLIQAFSKQHPTIAIEFLPCTEDRPSRRPHGRRARRDRTRGGRRRRRARSPEQPGAWCLPIGRGGHATFRRDLHRLVVPDSRGA